MLVGTPHLTLTQYFRDFCLGALEDFCSGKCFVCDASIGHLELRLRLVLDLPIFRGRCSGPTRHHFTFLPLFVAPGKWYGYPFIEKALRAIFSASVPNHAFEEWEAEREAFLFPDSDVDDRCQKDLFRIPSVTTLRRWWEEFEDGRDIWLKRAASFTQQGLRHGWSALLPACVPDGSIGEVRVHELPEIPFPSSSVRCLLRLLLSLGQILQGLPLSSAPVAPLGMGLWFLEVQFRQRCLARSDLLGRLIPYSFPNLSEMKPSPLPYAPKTSPP